MRPLPLDALASFRRDYARVLPSRVQRVARALHSWRNAPDNPRTRERARALAHRLRGNTGSYGFVDISAIVARLEDAILRAPDARLAAWDAIEADLRDAHARVAQAMWKLERDGSL